MRYLALPLALAIACCISSCGGKNSGDAGKEPAANDSLTNSKPVTGSAQSLEGADTTIAAVYPVAEKELVKWARTFRGFHVDSFHQTSKWAFEQEDYNNASDLGAFYELYKPALVFSPDSSMFIDLYSYGLMLEKKGRKIIASSDVDQSITLCNLKTKEWKRIAFFGPSVGIEEAVWISPSRFLIAGTMQDDDGEYMPVLGMGNTDSKTFRWFEAKTMRPKPADYKASGLSKLKIDMWE